MTVDPGNSRMGDENLAVVIPGAQGLSGDFQGSTALREG